MQLGVSLASAHPTADGPTAGPVAVERVIERARVADQVGLDSLSLGDHHATSFPYVQGVPMLARLTAEWDTTRPTGCLFLLPLWHPVLVAEQVGTLASMCKGTFVLQTGIGDGEVQFAAMGADIHNRGRDLDESIRVLTALFAGEPVSSERFGIQNATVNPRPPRPIEWWIGGEAPVALDRAARFGDAWYAGPNITATGSTHQIDSYRAACDEHSRAPRIMVRKDVVILEDGDRAAQIGDNLVAGGYRGLSRDALVCGGVDAAVEALAPLAGLGVEQVVVRSMAGISQADALETLELCGEVRAQLP